MTHASHLAFLALTAILGLPLIYALIVFFPAFWRSLRSPIPAFILAPAFASVANNGAVPDTSLVETQLVPAHAARQPAWPARWGRGTDDNTPPRRRSRLPWIFAAISLLVVLAILGVAVVTLSPQTAHALPLTEQQSGYLYVDPGHQVIYLQVQGALTSTTGTWLEADRTAHGVTHHQWTFQYGANGTTVHIVLSANTGDVALSGTIDNAQYTAMDVLLPVNNVGLFPPPAHFVAASPADWNSAYTSLVAGT